eukprot:3672905-Rhodomonas_salina.1
MAEGRDTQDSRLTSESFICDLRTIVPAISEHPLELVNLPPQREFAVGQCRLCENPLSRHQQCSPNTQ